LVLKNREGQIAIAGLLYFFMAIVIVALTMPLVTSGINLGVNTLNNNYSNSTNRVLIVMLIQYWPVFFIVMALVVLVILMRQ